MPNVTRVVGAVIALGRQHKHLCPDINSRLPDCFSNRGKDAQDGQRLLYHFNIV